MIKLGRENNPLVHSIIFRIKAQSLPCQADTLSDLISSVTPIHSGHTGLLLEVLYKLASRPLHWLFPLPRMPFLMTHSLANLLQTLIITSKRPSLKQHSPPPWYHSPWCIFLLCPWSILIHVSLVGSGVVALRLICPTARGNLGSPTRDQTHIPRIERQVLNHLGPEGSPKQTVLERTNTDSTWPCCRMDSRSIRCVWSPNIFKEVGRSLQIFAPPPTVPHN